MNLDIKSALISVYNKEGLEPVVRKLHEMGIKLYSTGGTRVFIEQLGISCISVESVTDYPSILGGRVKTLHPKIFGGILARRENAEDRKSMFDYDIPYFDLVIVDLYPFEETISKTNDEKEIIEKIDIGGVSLIRAAAKNFRDVCVISSRNQYADLLDLLHKKDGDISLEDRKRFASVAFSQCAHYDVAIADYFNKTTDTSSFQLSISNKFSLRYGENPQQPAVFYGELEELFEQLNGKALSYNNLVDVDAAFRLISEFQETVFAIIKHNNVCGIAERKNVADAWEAAHAGDPESAFGGVLITNSHLPLAVAEKINELFFEVLIAPGFDEDALTLLKNKKNRIILKQLQDFYPSREYKCILDGVLVQEADKANYAVWKEVGGRTSSEQEKTDLSFANIICKHLKSNAIAIVKDKQLIGKGCGQTSRIDAMRHALEKAHQFNFSLQGAVMASDAFFPFDDCVRMAHEAGITAIIQPGGSIRDNDSIQYCVEHNMAMVLTESRHFKH